jgi:hypothetical protein
MNKTKIPPVLREEIREIFKGYGSVGGRTATHGMSSARARWTVRFRWDKYRAEKGADREKA